MAATKTTKKTTTVAKPKEEVVEEVVETTTPASTTVAVDADELIKSIINNVSANDNKSHAREYVLCRSVTNGGLNINCKSGNVYELTEYGADCEIEYHDLAALVRKRSEHIFLPRLVIEDEDFLDEFPQVRDVYHNLYTAAEIDELFTLPPSQMIATIKSMPKNVADGLKNVATTKIMNGEIDSVRTIKALTDYYDCDFNLISELFGK